MRSFRVSSIRLRVVLLLALSMFPAAVLSVVQSISNLRLAAEMAEREVLQEAMLSAQDTRDVLNETHLILTSLAADPRVRDTGAACSERLARVPKRDRYGMIAVTGPDLEVACAYPSGREGTSLGGDDLGESLREEKRFLITDRLPGDETSEPVILAVKPILSQDRSVLGSVAASIRAEYLGVLLKRPDDGRDLQTAIVGRTGTVVAADGDFGAALGWVRSVVEQQNPFSRGARLVEADITGQEAYLYGIAPLFAHDMFLLIKAPDPAAHAGFNARYLSSLLIPFLMWLIALAVAWYAIDRFVVRWVVYMRRIARAYSKGKLALRTGPMDEAPEEFRSLGQTMNAMAEALDEREERLRLAVQEQKALLREVYHRVKNNLQIVASLVNLQLRDVATEDGRAALISMQGRLNALTLVHRSLYEANGLHSLNLARLMPDLVSHFERLYAPADSEIEVTTEIADLQIDPDRAVPLSLFLAEALTNAFMYNCKPGDVGLLHVHLGLEGETARLEIANSCRDEDLDKQIPPAGLGRRLMDGFARQIGGTVEVEVTRDRWKVRLSFPSGTQDEPEAEEAQEGAAAA